MRNEIVMPQMGESITTGTITKWHKNVGDKIEIDERDFYYSSFEKVRYSLVSKEGFESIVLHNHLGQIIYPKFQNNSGTLTLDLTQTPSGIYTLQIIKNDKISFTKRIVVY